MIDNNVYDLICKFKSRSDFGIKKYGTTTDRTDLTLRDWLQHALEEAMDLAVYLNRAIAELDHITSDPDYSKYIERLHRMGLKPCDYQTFLASKNGMETAQGPRTGTDNVPEGDPAVCDESTVPRYRADS